MKEFLREKDVDVAVVPVIPGRMKGRLAGIQTWTKKRRLLWQFLFFETLLPVKNYVLFVENLPQENSPASFL